MNFLYVSFRLPFMFNRNNYFVFIYFTLLVPNHYEFPWVYEWMGNNYVQSFRVEGFVTIHFPQPIYRR